MTSGAFHRHLPGLMAIEAKSHVHIDAPHGHRPLPHIAVTRRTINSVADMRSVVEVNVERGAAIKNAFPLDILPALKHGSHLLDLRFIRGHHLVARHAELDVGNTGDSALFHVDVAVRAFHPVRQVNLVRISDRLNGRGVVAEKIADGIQQSRMGRREDGRSLRLSALGRGLIGGMCNEPRAHTNQNKRGEQDQ